jgi:L-lysine exporter family protein LysE/ArgO
MMLAVVLHGCLLTLGLILPLGMQNIFILNQASAHKSLISALPCIITAAICDTFLILSSVLGISLIVLELPWLQNIILIFGFFFLIYIAYNTWKHASFKSTAKKALTPKKQIIFAISVSILNPAAIIDTITVIGSNALQYDGMEQIYFVTSCIGMSWLWFISLGFAGHCINKVDSNGKIIFYLNKISAIIILFVALMIGKEILSLKLFN